LTEQQYVALFLCLRFFALGDVKTRYKTKLKQKQKQRQRQEKPVEKQKQMPKQWKCSFHNFFAKLSNQRSPGLLSSLGPTNLHITYKVEGNRGNRNQKSRTNTIYDV